MERFNGSEKMTGIPSWFAEVRFGLFIHWGLYALPGGIWNGQEMDYIGEWLQAKFRIPNAEYSKLAEQFNPVEFDAEQWVSTAKNAGMKYMVFTAKHHEGFAMYHSKVSHYNIVDATPFKRDVLAELATACKKHDLKLGIYYSQDLDWHELDGGDPGPDCSKNFGMSWGNDWDFPDYSAKNFQRYFEGKVIPQITELMSNYGPISTLWFDCPMTISREDCEKLVQLVKKLQPNCLINSRIGNGLGDYGSLGDNQLPAARRQGMWETPGTLNDTWGFKYNDNNWKKAEDVIHTIAALAAKDTNYLLNIGPQPDGKFPDESVKILEEIGKWMNVYGEAIYGSSGNPFPYDFLWGWMTVSVGQENKCTKLNLILKESLPQLTLAGLNNRVCSCHEMAEPEKTLSCEQTSAGLQIDLSAVKFNDVASVIVIELDTCGEPNIDLRLIPQDGDMVLMPSSGILRHGELASEAGQRAVGAAGEKYEGSTGHSFLDETGCLVEWQNPSDSIEWELYWPQAGEYQLEIVLQSRAHSAPWVCGQTLRLVYLQDDKTYQWDVKLVGRSIENSTGECYLKCIAPLGNLRICTPGAGKLSLTMLDPSCQEALLMGLREIKVKRI